MAHADIHAVLAVHKLQKTQHILVVVQRFSDAHQHNVGDLQAGIQLGKQHLVQHLTGRKAPYQAADGGGAEGTPHGAAHLRGNTNRVPMVIPHEDSLHAISILQTPEVFDRSIQLGNKLSLDLRHSDFIGRIQLLPQRKRQICHIGKELSPPMEPGIDLAGTKLRLVHFPESSLQLRQGQIFDFRFQDFLLSFAIKNPSVPWSQGSSVSIPSAACRSPGSSNASRVKSGFVRRNAETTSSFSRFRIVQVL